ncbi:MAG: ATP-grasp domain-containing protein [Candidatus Nitrosopumilus sp. bin_6a]
MTNEKICVLIAGTGGGGTGMEILKSLKMATQEYKIVATDMWKNSFGLMETPYRYVIPPANSPEYVDSLLKICKKENVQAIATGSEPELKKVAQNSKIFEENGVKVLLNSWETIQKCTDKFTLTKILKSLNVPCPDFFLYENDDDLSKIKTFPVVIKPRVGGGSQNVFLAMDEEEAIFFTKYLKKYGFEPLVQEYVGDFNNEFTVGILYADNGKLLTSIAMNRLLGSGLSTRQTIVSKSNKKYIISSGISQGLIDDFKEIREMGIKIAKGLRVNGPVNIQCRKTDDEIIPFEINPRFSGTSSPRSLVGLNEPDIFCRYKLFGEIPTEINYKHGYVVRGLVEKFIDFNEAKTIPTI